MLWRAIVSGETYLLSHLELVVPWYQRALWTHKKEKKTQHIQIAIHPPTLLPIHPQLPIKSSALKRTGFLNTELCEKPLRLYILLSTPPDNLFRYEWSFQPIRRKKKLNISGNKIPIHTQSLHFQHYFHVPVRTGRRRKKPEPSDRNLSCPTFLWAGRAWRHLWGKAFQHHPPVGIWDLILESQANLDECGACGRIFLFSKGNSSHAFRDISLPVWL